jgi:hypothetical protein
MQTKKILNWILGVKKIKIVGGVHVRSKFFSHVYIDFLISLLAGSEQRRVIRDQIRFSFNVENLLLAGNEQWRGIFVSCRKFIARWKRAMAADYLISIISQSVVLSFTSMPIPCLYL